MNQLEDLVAASLRDFSAHVRPTGWRGREREAVSFFVTGFLSKRVQEGTDLHDLAQVVIEGAVAQRPDAGKRYVNKDLLIWPSAGMTCWNEDWEAVAVPSAVLEWKVHRPQTGRFRGHHEHDLDWLSWFTGEHDRSLGFAIALDLASSPTALFAARAAHDELDLDWLRC